MSAITIQKRPLASTSASTDLSRTSHRRRTLRGNVVRVVRERYLREDIACGVAGCPVSSCKNAIKLRLAAEKIPATGTRNGSIANGTQAFVCIIDSNVALGQMDLLESMLGNLPGKTPAALTFSSIVVPQTVLEEVRHRSLPLYNRLSALLDAPESSWVRFWNEAASATATVRQPGETPNDHADRAIRSVAEYYRSHLEQRKAPLEAVLLTDDRDNMTKARAAGLISLNGHFNASQYNVLEGSVRSDALGQAILIRGREAMNRAIDGDIVAVRLLPESQWLTETDEVKGGSGGNDDAGSDEEDDEAREEQLREEEQEDQEERQALARQERRARSSGGKPQPTGKVVGVVRRNWRSYVCTLDARTLPPSAFSSTGATSLLALPVSSRIPRIRIRTRQVSSLIDQKVLVALDDWRISSRYPDGHFVRALGRTESNEAEQESLLLEHDVPYRPFSTAVLDCLPSEGDSWKVSPKEQAGPAWRDRVDLRAEQICSIDPPGCQDIDDALHAKILPNGNVEAGVHIADVSYFVRSETPMDSEAASRGTTVYLVDKRIDMLPHLLGTNLCSLRPHVERLAFSAIWELNPKTADIVSVRFHKSVIASKEAFTYEEAQLRKDDPRKKDAITQSIRLLNDLAIKLKGKRMQAGALNLASPEVRIHLDSAESTAPIDVEQKEMRETNSLVEEFMLLANIYTHFTSPIRRYADVLTHRQLAAAIAYEPLPANLQNKGHVEKVLNNVNKRHRGAQQAGRASVEYWVGLSIARKNQEAGGSAKSFGTGEIKLHEDAFVIRTFRNGIAVFVSAYGLEGLITFDKDCDFDGEQYTVRVPATVSGLKQDLILGIFDRVRVEIGTEKDKNTQRSRVKMALL
ncbi:exosomal 3-5 exoribonuclease subunit rrp44 dis3 [Ceraceosorus bombacis]|uniref:Ribosomal RNA-processing protein 44 n=1 Tax=Ceraceosorus bombacis TaxID=401625 RepID=A0A0P1BRJ8_9BASI|nr:exosomal 3-5 exoribonuclease subunit rrp44 dis3 [Ceraceosorus bombacis]